MLHIVDKDCNYYDTASNIYGNDQPFEFAWRVWAAAIVTWIIVYFCVFKGVKSSSYVVWVTVPLPCLFILCMVVRGLTLEGAGDGIKMYLTGR